MARLIDVDKAIINFGFEWDDISPTREEFVEFLKRQPEIRERHGHWVRTGAYGEYECSECHSIDGNCSDDYYSHNVLWQDYCPYCGAIMDGEVE